MRINVFKSGGNSAQGGFVSNGLTLQGPLILSGPHTEPLHAVPKQYVDNAAYNLDANNITSGTLAAARLPAFTGDGTTILGSSNIILAATGVTPGSIVKPTVDAKGRIVSGGSIIESDITGIGFNKFTVDVPSTLNGYGITDAVNVTGNVTMSGQLIQSADPVNPDHAATKQYVDSSAGLAGGISIGDIIRKPYSATPSGFLKCNGAEVDKIAYSNLYSVIGDRFSNTLTSGCGKPWQLQYSFNETQTSDVMGWTIGTPLPGVLCHTTCVVTKSRVYCLGGYNGSAYTSTVYTAPIGTDGVIGTWVTTASLPLGLIASSGFVTNNKIYLVGGATGTGTYLSNVYYAPINSDGTIGSWVSGPSLPGLLGYTKVIVTKNRVYTLAGNNGSIAISTIYTAVINDDGTLGAWSAHGSLPYSGYLCYTAVIKDRLYVIGGYSSGYRRDVYYANIDSDGVIGSWMPGIFLPKGMSSGECFTTENKFHITFLNEVYTADIYSDGSLGTWYKSATLPYDMGETECVITSSKIYLISAATASYNGYVIYANFAGGSNDYSSFYGADTSNSNYSISGSGKPWQQQYQINTTQSADIGGWTDTGLTTPVAKVAGAFFVTKNRVYNVAGYSAGTYVNTVYTAPINTDGTLGSWTTLANYPWAIDLITSFVVKNKVYLIGGRNSSQQVGAGIYSTNINADGTIGSWTAETSFPIGICGAGVIVTKNKVHIIGGFDATNYYTATYSAAINIDGTLGTWVAGTTLPTAIGNPTIAVTKNRVYILGYGFIGHTVSSSIYYASINSDGTLGSWIQSGNLPVSLAAPAVFVSSNKIHLIGGWNGSAVITAIYTAPIDSNGVIGAFTTNSNLTAPIAWSNTVATSSKLYLINGYSSSSTSVSNIYSGVLTGSMNDYSAYYDGTNDILDTTINYTYPGSGKPWEQQYQINTTQTGDITGWTTSSNLPVTVAMSNIFVTKNRIYMCGGWTGTATVATVYTAPLNSDGTIGTWVTSASLPGILAAGHVFVTKNRVYICGGWSASSYTGTSSVVYTAVINADGTIGTWTTGASLPAVLQEATCVVTRNRVYLIGGWTSTTVATVYTAPINEDGTLGTWSTSASIPAVRRGCFSFVTKNRIYVLGGWDGAAGTNTVYTAIINSNGTLGPWVSAPNLPVDYYMSNIFVTKNRVYIIAGATGSVTSNAVRSAPINSDGTISSWSSGTSMSSGVYSAQFVCIKNKIYVLGGSPIWSGNPTSGVQTATILEGLNDYSPYYDGTIQPVSTALTKFKLPDYSMVDREFGNNVTSYIKF